MSDVVGRAYGRVAGGAPVPVPLAAPGRVPRSILLPVDVDTIDTSGAAKCDCEADGTGTPDTPRAPDPDDLVANPDAYAQDLRGACVDLTTPSRAVEEFSYLMAVRTSQPRVAGVSLDFRQTVPPALMADLLGVSIASQALGFTRSAAVELQSSALTLDVHAARSLVRTDSPPTLGAIAHTSWWTTTRTGGNDTPSPGTNRFAPSTLSSYASSPPTPSLSASTSIRSRHGRFCRADRAASGRPEAVAWRMPVAVRGLRLLLSARIPPYVAEIAPRRLLGGKGAPPKPPIRHRIETARE